MKIDEGKLKTEFNNRVASNTTILGKYAMEHLVESLNVSKVSESTYRVVKKVKKGDVIILTGSNKIRPHVILSVKKDKVFALALTTTDDYASSGIPHNSRFLEDGFFGTTLCIINEGIAKATFACVLDNHKQLNKAIKYIKELYNSNI